MLEKNESFKGGDVPLLFIFLRRSIRLREKPGLAKESWKILSDILSDETASGQERLRRVRQELGGQRIRIPPFYYQERDKKIHELKAKGKTITTIAEDFNLSVDRVKAILYKSNKKHR